MGGSSSHAESQGVILTLPPSLPPPVSPPLEAGEEMGVARKQSNHFSVNKREVTVKGVKKKVRAPQSGGGEVGRGGEGGVGVSLLGVDRRASLRGEERRVRKHRRGQGITPGKRVKG